MQSAVKTASPRFILGIDPGRQGALVLLDTFRPADSIVYDMPVDDQGVQAAKLASIVGEVIQFCAGQVGPSADIHAYVENVNSRPRQAGAFAFGLSTGIIHGVLASFSIPFTLVAPSQWKPSMGLRRAADETQDQNKDRARALASKLLPDLAHFFARKKDDGRAEALLLALYYHHKRK